MLTDNLIPWLHVSSSDSGRLGESALIHTLSVSDTVDQTVRSTAGGKTFRHLGKSASFSGLEECVSLKQAKQVLRSVPRLVQAPGVLFQDWAEGQCSGQQGPEAVPV